MKMLVAYLDVILLFVSQTSTFDFLNPIYFKIFGFILYTNIPGGSKFIISVRDYVDSSFTALGSSVDFESFRVFLILYFDHIINIILIIYEVLKE